MTDVERFLELLWRPGDVREVRIPDAGYGSRAGYFDEPAKAAAAATEWDGKASIYVTLNPVRPDLLARAVNRLAKLRSTTADVDVIRRRWLLVDVDARRPSGISATDAETAAALEVARAVTRELRAEGWADPLAYMSGNGYGLLYPVDLPNDAETTALVAGWLRALAARFDTDTAGVDTAVSNAARIACLVGTLKVKGDATAERPHRRSAVVYTPAEFVPVTREQLEALAGPTNGHRPPGTGESGRHFGWVRERLDAAGVQYKELPPDESGRQWYALRPCPFCGELRDCGVAEGPDGKAYGKCFHKNRFDGKGWADFRDALRLGGVRLNLSESPERSAGGVVEPAPAWPAPPTAAAYHGVAGEIALAVAEHTEPDPAGVLGVLLTTFGALAGHGRYLYQGSAQAANLFTVLVGDSAVSRKGTTNSIGRQVFDAAYPDWTGLLVPGLGSGEGLIGHYKRIEEGEHRALVYETELGRLLTVANREGSTLSPVLRDAWDGSPLGRNLARDGALVTWHHVGLLGHITPTELRAKLTSLDAVSGFGNRFLWLAVRRTKLVPRPADVRELAAPYTQRLHAAIMAAQVPGELRWTLDAEARWDDVYAELTGRPRLGMAGAIAARAEAQIARLALVYALLDVAEAVGVEHLEAALALWGYAERSAVYLFGASTGNRHADLVLRLLRSEGTLDRQAIKAETGLKLGAELDELERVLVDAGLAELVELPREDGRPQGRKRRALRLRLNGLNGVNGPEAARTKDTKNTHDIVPVYPVKTVCAPTRGQGPVYPVKTVKATGFEQFRAEAGTDAAWRRAGDA